MGQSRAIRITGYVVFGLFAFLVSLYLTFPAQVVGGRIEQEVRRATRGALQLDFADMSLYRFTGVAAKPVGVTVHSGRSGRPFSFTLDSVRARVQILPLFLLRLALTTTVGWGEGELTLTVSRKLLGEPEVRFEIVADAVDLASPPILQQLASLPLAGVLAGTAAGRWTGKPATSTATTSVTVSKGQLGPGTVAGFTIPAIGLGDLSLVVEMDKGRLQVSSFQQDGGQLSLRLEGSSVIRPLLAASTLDACVQLKADDELLRSHPKLRTALQLAEVQLRKDTDAYLHMPLTGSLAAPRLRGGLCRRRAQQ